MAGLTLARKQWAAAYDSLLVEARQAASLLVTQEIDLSHTRDRWAWRRTTDAETVREANEEVLQLSRRRAELSIERNALVHVAAKLASRARLKPAKRRNEADRATLTTLTQFIPRIAVIEQATASLAQNIARAAARSNDALLRDMAALRADQDAAAERQLSSGREAPATASGPAAHPSQLVTPLIASANPESASTQTPEKSSDGPDPSAQATVSTEVRKQPIATVPAHTVARAVAETKSAVASKPASSPSPAVGETRPTQPRADTSIASDIARAKTAPERPATSVISIRPDQPASAPATQKPPIIPMQRQRAAIQAAADQAIRSQTETITVINNPEAPKSQAPGAGRQDGCGCGPASTECEASAAAGLYYGWFPAHFPEAPAERPARRIAPCGTAAT